ncbi:MAG: signal peptidase I [Chloroflexota bacterium]|nr:signal peptidase I [Chloroflexota bacterium]
MMSERGNETFQEPEAGPPSAPGLDASATEPASLSRAFGGPSLLREILETALLTLIVFLILNTLTGRFQVRGSSMEPTLQDGQYLVISKLAYWLRPPKRGDIVVFHPPNGASDDYIKRIVGLPGEQLRIVDGEVRVNGVAVEEPYVVRQGAYSGSWELEADKYFVLGDNRANSSDSHTWGTLPEENIIGKAWLCYWPPEAWGLVEHEEFPEPARPG